MNQNPFVVMYKDVEAFLLEANRQAYDLEARWVNVPEQPRSLSFRYERDHYLYVNTRYTGEDEMGTFGWIVIWHKQLPVWWMTYRSAAVGNDRVSQFLNEALLATDKFVGGRGPTWFRKGPLEYRNRTRGQALIHNFSGEEIIYDSSGPDDLLYELTYSGGMIDGSNGP